MKTEELYQTQSKYISNLKLSKYSQWKLSGWLVCDVGQVELAVIIGQFCLLCRQVYRKISKQARKQACMQVSGHGSNQVMATYA